MYFLGIDLGWQSGGSGVCCLQQVSTGLALCHFSHCDSRSAVLAAIDHLIPADAPALIAVDAPTLIPNATGMRVCDRLAHRYFGKYDAGCYPANRGRPFAAALIEFGLALESRGFQHAAELAPQTPGRYQIELFPHPATIHLFRLQRILKYKKGRIAARRQALEQLRQLQLSTFPTSDTPALPLSAKTLPVIPSGGKLLKAVEDQLDSLTCAYGGAHWWWWGLARNWVLGDAKSGYIVVPAPYADQIRPPLEGA